MNKNSSKITKSSKSSSAASALVKGMSAKPLKKPQSKTAPAKVAHKKKPEPKLSAKAVVKAASKLMEKVVGKTTAKIPQVTGGKTPKQTSVEGKAATKGKTSADTKVAKGKDAPVMAVLSKKEAAAAKKASAAPAQKASSSKKSKSAAYLEHSEKMCRENGCENVATTKGYCRLDYIKNWKKIKRKEMILKEGKLNQYIEELVGKYPDKYIDIIRQDLSTEVNFTKVIHDLELDESIDDLDYDGDSIDSLIGSIRKDGEGGIDDDEF